MMSWHGRVTACGKLVATRTPSIVTCLLQIIVEVNERMKGEQKVLDYHDVLLYKSDLDLLMGPHWLNDQVLAAGLQVSASRTSASTEPVSLRSGYRVLLRVSQQGALPSQQYVLLRPCSHLFDIAWRYVGFYTLCADE
jgi:hypothetical protein